MLEYDRIDVSEGIDVNKASNSRECSCDGCHDMSMKANSMQNLAIIYHKRNAYHVNFVFMSKNDAFNLMKNSNIIDKKGVS